MRRVLALTLPCLLLAAAPAAAAETDVKVSELRFRGPAGGNDEFVELVNTGPVRQSIAGFRLVGCSASGPTGTRATVPAARSIPPGGRYLFANSGSSGLGADQSYGTGISDTGGVQVVGAGGTVLDQAGAAASACKEGAGLAIPTANGDNAFERRAGGAQDTNDNAADFEGPKASGATACGAPCVDAAAPPPSGEAASVHAIQGAGHRSPLLGRAVTTSGVVIARRANGFYLQEPRPDADPATSEGIFVFTGGEPPAVAAVGAAVQVAGTVAEFRPGGSATANLSITQITRATVTGTGTGSVAPTVIGAGGRVAPTMVIEDDVNGDVERAGTFDPAQDGLDFYESLEGMLVRVNDAVAVGPTSPFGEIPVLADGGAGAGLRSQRGGIVVRPGDFNPERLFLDDAIAADEPAVDVRDRLAGPVDAVVDYSFGNFKLLATAWPGVTDGGLEREVTAAPAPDQLAVASFNVENLDPGDPAEKFDRLARTVVENLRSPDVLTVEEV